jgi:hypothetical protein
VTGTVVILVVIVIAFVVVHLTVGSPFAHGGGSVAAGVVGALR